VLTAIPADVQATGALTRYDVHAVVANILHTRKDRVLIVRKQNKLSTQPQGDAATMVEVIDVRRSPSEEHIEGQLVGRVVLLHNEYMASAA